MIKKFISKGIMGVPDMELELEDEKIILIKGPNGSGKSSLLHHITHPLSSFNGRNRLQPGVQDGYLIMYFTYKGIDYKVQHILNKKKNGVQINSYLAKKTGTDYEELVENGLPTNFKEKVKIELDYDSFLYNIMNIGISNRGLVDFTNTERIEYLKKILRLDILNEIKENTLSNFKDLNANYKFLQNKLSEYPLNDVITKEINECKEKTLNITANQEIANNKLNKLSINEEKEEYLKESKNDILLNIEDLNNINKVIKDKYPDITYEKYINELKEDITSCKASINMANKEMEKINEEILSIKEVDNEKLEKERKEILSTIESINSKYIDKKFPDTNLNTIYEVRNYISLIKEYLSEATYNDIEIRKYFDNPNEAIEKESNKIKELEESIITLEDSIKEMDISYNLIEIGKNSHDEDCLPSCPFRKEYNRQLDLVDLRNRLEKEKLKKEEELEELKYSIEELKMNTSIIKRIKNTNIPDNIKDFTKKKVKDILSPSILSNLYDEIIASEFYYKDMEDVNKLYDSLSKIDIELEASNKSISDRKGYLLEELKRYNNLIKEEKTRFNSLTEEYKKNELELFNYNNANIKSKDIDNDIKVYNNKLEEINNTINNIEESRKLKKQLERELEDYKVDMQKTTEKFYELKTQLKDRIKIDESFKEVASDVEKMKILKDIVSIKLPARILETYLYDVSHMVNNLLEDFMTIRFDTNDGVDILINREGIERYSSELSQGEKSILSMALLMAFKKQLPWDIISLDEVDATLDENNKAKFIYMIRDYANLIPNLNQIFIVSHTEFNDEGLDVKTIYL